MPLHFFSVVHSSPKQLHVVIHQFSCSACTCGLSDRLIADGHTSVSQKTVCTSVLKMPSVCQEKRCDLESKWKVGKNVGIDCLYSTVRFPLGLDKCVNKMSKMLKKKTCQMFITKQTFLIIFFIQCVVLHWWMLIIYNVANTSKSYLYCPVYNI